MSEEVVVAEVDAGSAPAVVEEAKVEEAKPSAESTASDGNADGSAEEAKADEAKNDEPKKTDEQPEKPGKNRFERRLGNAYRKLGEAEARARMLEQRLQEVSRPAQIQGAPTLEQFGFDAEQYAKAYAEFETNRKFSELNRVQQAKAAEAAQRQLMDSWSDKAAKAFDKYDDFDEVVGELKPTSPAIVAIMQADNAADIAYYLGKHTKEAQRIGSLDPVSQIREIGRLEAKLSLEPIPNKQPSKAPAPIKPISGATTVESGLKPQMSYEDFVKVRNKQLGRT